MIAAAVSKSARAEEESLRRKVGAAYDTYAGDPLTRKMALDQ